MRKRELRGHFLPIRAKNGVEQRNISGTEGSHPAAKEGDMDEIPKWGASAFVATARRRLRTRELGVAVFKHVNFILLGPAGVGKSSLIHTLWRAVSGSSKSDPGLLERLAVGWTAGEAEMREKEEPRPGGLRARHGTTTLAAYALQSRLVEDGVRTSIFAQDSKGQQFYDEDERSFAERLVSGILKNGSSADRESMYFWAIVAKVGLGRFVKTTALAHSPHAVVFVFDMTLRSFQRALNGNDAALVDCYRQVAKHAQSQGLTLFAVLTHVDVYELQVQKETRVDTSSSSSPFDENDHDAERRIGEAVKNDVDAMRYKLATAIGDDLLPAANVFPIVNYNVNFNSRDDAVELAALEFLTAVFDAAESFLANRAVQHHVNSQKSCLVS